MIQPQPTVKVQKWIKRSDLLSNPDTLYLFGDNVLRHGLGGQAKEMRYERNAVGVPTKWSPRSEDYAFFSDKDYKAHVDRVDRALEPVFRHVKAGRYLVIPADGLGTGLSELPTRAPRLHAYINSRLNRLLELGFHEKVF